MKILSFAIPMKPYSLNSMHKSARNGRRYKTDKAIAFENSFNFELNRVCGEDLTQLSSEFNRFEQAFKMECYFYINFEEFFTLPKKGIVDISRRSLDLDNCLKNSIDLIFRYMNIDDKYLVEISAKKLPTNNESSMVFILERIPFPRSFKAFDN